MRYPGGKGGAGVYQTIINNIPPHDVYIETHLGGGNIFERKKPAKLNIAIDADKNVIELWRQKDITNLELHHADAVEFLSSYKFTENVFVYADPPYILETRKGGKLYKHEYTDKQHEDLLDALLLLPCLIMISGYKSELYESKLSNWRRKDFNAMTRGGLATESLWMNYEAPNQLHDLNYLGNNFRERERIKRKKIRWRTRLEKLDALERAAILEVIRDLELLENKGNKSE